MVIPVGLSEYLDHYVAVLNDANVDQVMKFYPKSGPCFMPSNHPRVGWCSRSISLYKFACRGYWGWLSQKVKIFDKFTIYDFSQ